MKAYAAIGILLICLPGLAFSQDASEWGPRSVPQDRSNTGSPFGRAFNTESGRITGTVVASDGKPQQDVRVQIQDSATGGILASTYTGVSGVFSFDMLPYGRYELIATSGVTTTRQEVEVRDSFSVVNLSLSTSDPNASPSRNGLVSIAELKVPQRARDAYARAREAMVKHQPEKMSKYLQKALEIYPAYAPAITMLGALSLDKNDLTAAVDEFDKAIHADSAYAMAHVGMAATLNRLSKFDEALRAGERASALAPNFWQPYYEMAKSYIGKTDYQRALQQLNHAQGEIAPEYAPLHLLRASVLLALKNYQDAAPELKLFLKIARKDDPAVSAAKDALAQVNALVSSTTARTEKPR